LESISLGLNFLITDPNVSFEDEPDISNVAPPAGKMGGACFLVPPEKHAPHPIIPALSGNPVKQ